MPEQLSKDEFWKIYELLPEDLKDAIFSVETADNIALACKMAGVEDERESKVAKLVGLALLGLIPPDEFPAALKQEAELNAEEAKKVSHQIQRLIFSRVKDSLAILYGKESQAQIGQLKEGGEEEVQEKTKPSSTDIYREPIE